MDKIRVLIVDDHPVFRAGLKTVLEYTDEIEVVAQAGYCQKGIYLAEKLQPDVVLLDVEMPKVKGIEAISQILQLVPHTQIIMISTFDEAEYIYQSIKAGAKGYILKNSEPHEYLQVIRAASRGELRLSPEVSTNLGQYISGQRKRDKLTKREQDVLYYLVQGLRNKEIAEELGIRDHTVKHHVANIRAKLGVKSRTEAVSQAIKEKLIYLDKK